MTRWYTITATVPLAAIFAIAGCTTDPSAAPDPDAVAIVAQDDNGITGTLTRDGIALTVETRTEGAGAVARVVDERDRTIAIGFFGHTRPPAWLTSRDDIAVDDPARLALAHAQPALAALALPAQLQAHGRALVDLAASVPAILDLEARVATDPEGNVAAVDALAPGVLSAVEDYYGVLASEPVVRRAYTLSDKVAEADAPVAYTTGCSSFDRTHTHHTVLGFTAFKFHQYRRWCWNTSSHVMSSPGDRYSYATNVNSTMYYDGWWVNADDWWSYPYQHHYFTQGQFRNCVVKYGCIATYYPWIESWVDGWGSSSVNHGE